MLRRALVLAGLLSLTASLAQCGRGPNTGTIAFQDARYGDYDIFTVREDGSREFRVTSSNEPNLYPTLSPDGNHIAFVSYENRLAQIFRIDSSGKNIKRLSDGTANDTEPSWSPDGTRIAFVSHRPTALDPAQHVYVMDKDGTNVRQITSGVPADSHPVWSPDGKELLIQKLFVLYRVDVNNGQLTPLLDPLTFNGAFDGMWFGAWAPDSRSIAFLADGGLYVTPDYGLTVQKVDTRDLFLAQSAITWSPDGKSIVFTARGGIFIVSTDGTKLTRLLSSDRASWPSWAR